MQIFFMSSYVRKHQSLDGTMLLKSCNFIHSQLDEKNNVFAGIYEYLVFCLSIQSFKGSNRI